MSCLLFKAFIRKPSSSYQKSVNLDSTKNVFYFSSIAWNLGLSSSNDFKMMEKSFRMCFEVSENDCISEAMQVTLDEKIKN